MKKKAVIFDMDGVLVDSEPEYLGVFRRFLEANHCEVNEEVLQKIAGANSRQTWEIAAQLWYQEEKPEVVRKLFYEFEPDFVVPYGKVVFPGVEKVLGFLKEKGIDLALASSSSEESIRRMLEETGFAPYFSCVVSGKQFAESKPNPEIYLYALSQLGVTAQEALAVEDSTYGIQAAKNAGLEVAAIKDTRFGYEQSQADYLVEQPADLRKLFETILK